MFHIFRWRRERRNATIPSTDFSIDPEHKTSHVRRHRLPTHHGRESLERLFHLRKHRSLSSSPNKNQVIRQQNSFS